MSLPLKTELFVAIHSAGPNGIWEEDAVNAMLATDNVGNKGYWKDMAKFWLAEMVGNCVIAITEQKEDSNYYGRPATLSKYVITDLGNYRFQKIL